MVYGFWILLDNTLVLFTFNFSFLTLNSFHSSLKTSVIFNSYLLIIFIILRRSSIFLYSWEFKFSIIKDILCFYGFLNHLEYTSALFTFISSFLTHNSSLKTSVIFNSYFLIFNYFHYSPPILLFSYRKEIEYLLIMDDSWFMDFEFS